jgi:catechol 2,3-dioxygenase-like lactoylglutathione lyase family enzyme
LQPATRIRKLAGNQIAWLRIQHWNMNTQCEYRAAQRQGNAVVNPSKNVTLRVNNLKLMRLFYQYVLGFKLLGEFPSAALLQAGADSGEQIQMLGLLERSIGLEPEHNSVGRVAFNIQVEDHEFERKRLQRFGLSVDTMNHERIGKRSFCFRDPEGNEVELICFGPTLAR